MMTRRGFFSDGSVVLLGMILAPQYLKASTWLSSMKAVALEDLHCSTFTPYLHSVFSVMAGRDHRVDLELVEAKENSSRGPLEGAERFSLVFRGSKETMLGQGAYLFSHSQIGRFELFIVPVISRDQSRATYEAIFNRLTPPPRPT
jgi:hypothetical protein